MRKRVGVVRTISVGLALGGLCLMGCDELVLEEAEQAVKMPPHAGKPSHHWPPWISGPAFTWTADDPRLEWGPCPDYMPEGCEIAVVQGDPADDNADLFFKLAPDSLVPHHWHSSAERMVLLSGEMVVDYDGQDPVGLTPGTYAFGPGGLGHETYCAPGDECVLFIAFETAVDAIDSTEEPAPGSDEPAFTWTKDDPGLEWGPCPDYMPASCAIAVLQGDPAERNADIFFRMAPNTRIPLHYHTSAERMVLVSGKMIVNYWGQMPTLLTPMTYAYGPAELPHSTRCLRGEECVLFIAFEEPVDAPQIGGGKGKHKHKHKRGR
jgi:quercetin dioxygenase-like cupin family protein